MHHDLRIPQLHLALLACLLLGGCAVDRVIEVRSEPPGATVTINGEPILIERVVASGDVGGGEHLERVPAVTPVDVPFDHYGTFDITVRHPDRLSGRRSVELDAPWMSYPPLDLLVELFAPRLARDHRAVRFELAPVPELDDDAAAKLLGRMEELRGEIPPRPEAPSR